MAKSVHLEGKPDLVFQSDFDFEKARVIRLAGVPARYTLVDANAEKAYQDILFCFARAKIRAKDPHFVFSEDDMYRSVNSDFTHLTLSAATATWKLPKYPLRLYFTTRTDVLELKNYYTGELFYLKNGQLGKYAINYWRFTKKYGCDERVQFNGTL